MSFSRVIAAAFFLGLLGFGGLFGFYSLKDWSYPIQRTITRADGKSLEVNILGRSGDSITFTPTTTDNRYDIEIGELALKDQWLKWVLPDIAAPKQEAKETDSYILNRLKEIERLEKKRAKLWDDMRSPKVNWILRQKARRDLPKVSNEITKLKVSIEEYKLRQKR